MTVTERVDTSGDDEDDDDDIDWLEVARDDERVTAWAAGRMSNGADTLDRMMITWVDEVNTAVPPLHWQLKLWTYNRVLGYIVMKIRLRTRSS